MIEFIISFRYKNMDHKAGVVKKDTEKETIYAVRPVDPALVRKFGKQIRIFKRDEHFNTHNHIDVDYTEFFNSVVEALRAQDFENNNA